MNNSCYVETIKQAMIKIGTQKQLGYCVPELYMYITLSEPNMKDAFEQYINVDEMYADLKDYLAVVPNDNNLIMSDYMKETFKLAERNAITHNRNEIRERDMVEAMFSLDGAFINMLLDPYQSVKDDLLKIIDETENNIDYAKGLSLTLAQFSGNSKSTVSSGNPTSNQRQSKANVTNLAQCLNGTITHPIIGRTAEIERTIQILARATKNNPIHVGEPGVGKTAIVEGLTKMIDEGNVPDILKNAKIYALNIGDLVAGTCYRGDLEGKLKKLLQSLEKEDNAILYIDEIHNIVGAGASGSGSLDVSNMLKPYLTSGKIKFIGATTDDEYKKFFAKDKALIRRFQKVTVLEPTIDESIEILTGLKDYYEDYHKIVYTEEALRAAVELSAKYVNDRFLPDKAIDLIDEAGAYLNTYGNTKVVEKSLIEEILSKTCKIPKETVSTDETMKLRFLDKEIKANLYGQDQAVDEIVKAVKIARAGLIDDNKPIASMLMVGPTGVGKTELARTLADTLGISFIKFDMSEYMDKTSVNKLIGANAGYVGYEEGGILVDKIRKNPHCVLLLDEIEKAHPDIFNVLLQVMDDAVLTDNQGNQADFKNVIILMTSNAGASEIGKATIGFESKEINTNAISSAVNKIFTPEFRNRLSGTVVFNAMDESMATLITKKQLKILEKKLSKVSIKYTDDVIQYIVNEGLKDKQYGGRAIKRVIENELKPLFVDEILFGKLKNGGSCKISIQDDKFKLSCKSPFKKTKVKVATAV